jgi:hypothetical protein
MTIKALGSVICAGILIVVVVVLWQCGALQPALKEAAVAIIPPAATTQPSNQPALLARDTRESSSTK